MTGKKRKKRTNSPAAFPKKKRRMSCLLSLLLSSIRTLSYWGNPAGVHIINSHTHTHSQRQTEMPGDAKKYIKEKTEKKSGQKMSPIPFHGRPTAWLSADFMPSSSSTFLCFRPLLFGPDQVFRHTALFILQVHENPPIHMIDFCLVARSHRGLKVQA